MVLNPPGRKGAKLPQFMLIAFARSCNHPACRRRSIAWRSSLQRLSKGPARKKTAAESLANKYRIGP
jgi:hypothetical protein